MNDLADPADSAALSGVGFFESFDVVILGDMSRPGDAALRIAGDVLAASGLGWRTGLVHLPTRASGPRIAAEVQRCVRDGLAETVHPTWTTEARLLIAHSPHLLSLLAHRLQRIIAREVVIVADEVPDYDVAAKDRAFHRLFGRAAWLPTNRWVRMRLANRLPPLRVEPEDWMPVAISIPRRPDGRTPTLGWITTAGPGSTMGPACDPPLPDDGEFAVHVLGDGTASPGGGSVAAIRHGTVALERFLSRIDVLGCFPETVIGELPDGTVAAAMAAGKAVVLGSRLEPHYGPGAIYCEPGDAAPVIRRLLADPPEREAAGASAARHATERYAREPHGATIQRLAGIVDRPAATRERRPRTALFLSLAGHPSRHLNTLLAVARRLGSEWRPVFVTTGADSGLIESFGFIAERLTSFRPAGSGPRAWAGWFAAETERLIDAHDAHLVVLGGDEPPSELAALFRRLAGPRVVWVPPPRPSAFAPGGVADLFDLVVVPGDLAAPAAVSGTTLAVDPVLLLDEVELLPRDEAAAGLGLDPSRPSVLVRLGDGPNRDVTAVLEGLMARIDRYDGLQVAALAGRMGPAELAPWPRVRVVAGVPISRFFHAFDFAISTADHAAFHEAIGFAKPTILVADGGPAGDDERTRIRFAEEAGVALSTERDKVYELSEMIPLMLSEAVRGHLAGSCRAISRPNGAAVAAEALLELVATAET